MHQSCAEIVFDELDDLLEFTLTEEGEPYIGINSDITFSIDGRVIFDNRKAISSPSP